MQVPLWQQIGHSDRRPFVLLPNLFVPFPERSVLASQGCLPQLFEYPVPDHWRLREVVPQLLVRHGPVRNAEQQHKGRACHLLVGVLGLGASVRASSHQCGLAPTFPKTVLFVHRVIEPVRQSPGLGAGFARMPAGE
ncbi:MAG: hypothetical protein EBS30_00090 [Planctomycetes bacterium]|nr:hypothetical protein [Planctomycetota bacterium]